MLRRPGHEEGTRCRLRFHGPDPAGHRLPHAVEHARKRPYRHHHAVPDRGGDDDGLPQRLHPDGHGRAVFVACLSVFQSRTRRAADPRPGSTAVLRDHDQRRAHRRAAVPLHGLSGRAREPDQEAVPRHPCRHGTHPRIAGCRHPGHLRHIRHCHRHRRRGGDADGAAGPAGHAASRLRHQAFRRRDRGGRHPRHPHSAVHHADRLRRHRRRVGGAVVRGRTLPRHAAGGPVYRVRNGGVHAQAEMGSTLEQGSAHCSAAAAYDRVVRAVRQARPALPAAYAFRQGRCRCSTCSRWPRSAGGESAGTGVRPDHGTDLELADQADRGVRHLRPGRNGSFRGSLQQRHRHRRDGPRDCRAACRGSVRARHRRATRARGAARACRARRAGRTACPGRSPGA